MNSQLVEVGIGLALTFFFVALIGSAIVELVAVVMKKRANDLDRTIAKMLANDDLHVALKETSIYRALQIGSSAGRDGTPRLPSYVPARAFADATIEVLAKKKKDLAGGAEAAADLVDFLGTGPLGDRLLAVTAEVGGDLTAAKAQVEAWFDDTMERLQGAYKRWSRWILLGVGLGLAIPMNISATQIATRLWDDTVVRQAVVGSASAVVADPKATDKLASIDGVVAKIGQLNDLHLPIGWRFERPGFFGCLLIGVGWVITGLMAMLGAPFWFDVMRRLTSLRGTAGPRPAPAAADPLSASFATMSAVGNERPAPHDGASPEQRLLDLIPSR